MTVNRISFDVRHDIAIGNPIRIHGLPQNWNWRGIHAHGRGPLAIEGNRRSAEYLDVLLHDVEDRVIVKIVDANKVAVLLPPVHFPLALPCNNNTLKMTLVILGILLPNLFAGVKEAGLSGAESTNAGKVGGLGHDGLCQIVSLPKTQYTTYVFLP